MGMNKFFLFLLLSFLVAAKPAYAGDIRIPAKGGGLYQVVIVIRVQKALSMMERPNL